MTYYEIVMKLIGPIRPVGETHTDDKRFENLQELTKLVDQLLYEIDYIAMENNGHHEHSRNRAGKHCWGFLDDLGIVE